MSDELKIHIYPSDCDTAGHVNHANILMLLERARWSALEKHMRFEDYVKRAQWAVVRHVEASYSTPALPGDDFIVRTGLQAIGKTSFTVRQVATNQRGAPVCEAKVVYVTLSPEGKPMPVPDEWREIFSPWGD
ncbi:MAG: thioesterase family protein [Gemmatimonadaceae bacterium]|nr:thioesterase family protein [Gemmatimonadaceae bacterium]